MEWIVDPTALDWTHERLDEFASARVTSLVPRGYEAYARIVRPSGLVGPPEPDEAAALIDVLRPFADDGERCRFGVWEGYGWVWGGVLTMSTDPAVHGSRPAPDEWPVPAPVRDGPRASRPSRSYVLYTGTLDEALALGGLEHRWIHDETPDLWWPEGRTWFVGADTDLSCTYVGGPRALIDRLLADTRLETEAVDPGNSLA